MYKRMYLNVIWKSPIRACTYILDLWWDWELVFLAIPGLTRGSTVRNWQKRLSYYMLIYETRHLSRRTKYIRLEKNVHIHKKCIKTNFNYMFYVVIKESNGKKQLSRAYKKNIFMIGKNWLRLIRSLFVSVCSHDRYAFIIEKKKT